VTCYDSRFLPDRLKKKMNTGQGRILFCSGFTYFQLIRCKIRMLQDKNFEKATFKIDWDKWVDQDEADEGFDTSALVMF
jgi:hypothetical protein